MKTPIERFDALWRLNPATGCHDWFGYRLLDGTPRLKGYGRFGFQGRVVYAHRWIFEYVNGPIPEGLQIDHFVCSNARCVNEAHMRAVTPRENVLRANGSVSSVNRAKTHCPQGHLYDEANTYLSTKNQRGCLECRRTYDRKRRPRKRPKQPTDPSSQGSPS